MMLLRPVCRATTCAKNLSGRKSIVRSAGTARTTFAALADVQQQSLSALTAAEVLMYAITTAPGNRAFQARNSSAVTDAASEQPARRSGSSTVLSGHKIAAVSAMKCTPQKTISSLLVAAAF